MRWKGDEVSDDQGAEVLKSLSAQVALSAFRIRVIIKRVRLGKGEDPYCVL